MPSITLLLIYCAVIVVASLLGGWVPQMVRLTHQRMELAISGVAGFMLGVGLLHMLPHATHGIGSIDRAVLWLLAGFLAMFFIERFFRYHHHEAASENGGEQDHAHGHSHAHGHDHAHDHDHGHAHDAASDPAPGSAAAEPPPRAFALSWSGAAVGLTLHSILDGVALAAAAYASSSGDSANAAAGVAVFMVILLHRPFDSMTLVTLMAAGGWSPRARHAVNGLFALAIPLGALLFYMGIAGAGDGSYAVGCALAFSAGTFLCISTSDLLPELQFHQHDRIPLSIVFLTGLGLAWGVSRLDAHDHDHASPAQVHEHVEHEHGEHEHQH